MGRKSKKEAILSKLDLVKQLKSQGVSDLKIISALNVCPATFYKVLKESPELQEAMEAGRVELVSDLTNELVRKAKPHILKTVKTINKNGDITTETVEKYVDGDLGAIIFLLKNKDKENWTNEPNILELKKKELELKEKLAEQNNW